MYFHWIQDIGKHIKRPKDHKHLSRGCGKRSIIVNRWSWRPSWTPSWILKNAQGWGQFTRQILFMWCRKLQNQVRKNYISQVRVCSPGCLTMTAPWQKQSTIDHHLSALLQIMAWCRQATRHHLEQCWKDFRYHMVLLPLRVCYLRKCGFRFNCFYNTSLIEELVMDSWMYTLITNYTYIRVFKLIVHRYRYLQSIWYALACIY